MRRIVTAEGVLPYINFVEMVTGLLMGMQQLDASSQGVSDVAIYMVPLEKRKWPTSQFRLLSPRHHSLTVSARSTLRKAGEK